MFGLSDDIQELVDELKRLKNQLNDLKVLSTILVNNPDNTVAREAVKIALKNIN